MAEERDLVLWDGDCGFCRRGMRWFAARDRDRRLELVPFQQAPSPPMTPALAAACEKAIYVVHPDGRMIRAGRALLYLLGTVGYEKTARVLSWPPLVWGVELAYWVIARNRHVFSRFLFTTEIDDPAARRG